MRLVDPPQVKIYESWDPFPDFFYEDHQGWIVPGIDKIQRLADNYDYIIANCSTEHWGCERDHPLVARLHDLFTEHFGKDFVCLCHDPDDQLLRPRIMYFPFWACAIPKPISWRGKDWVTVHPAYVACPIRKYLFSNLNHAARDFRIANWLWLRQKPYADKCLITMHSDARASHDYDGHFALTAAESLTWQQLKPGLPAVISDGFTARFDLRHPALCDTYLHVVSESTIKDKIFLTEKTWQPIFAGQLFIIWGNPGIISHLRDLEVDVFDDLVNHEYDLITDHRTRLTYIHQELDRLASMNWPEIYRATVQRRQNNADGFASGMFISKYVNRLKQLLPEGTPLHVSRC